MNRPGKSVYGRFLRTLLPLTILLALTVFAAFEWYRFENSLVHLEREIQTESATTSILLGRPVFEGNIDQIRLILATTIANPNINGVTVYDSSGKTLDSYGVLAGDPNCKARRTSINYSDATQLAQLGTLVLCYSEERLIAQTLDVTSSTLVLIVLILLLTSFIAYLSYRNAVGLPLTQLSEAINERLAGRTMQSVSWPSEDEIGQVIAEFNAMRDLIHKQEQETRDYQADLERAISERTRDLAEKTDEANRTNKLLEAQQQTLTRLEHEIVYAKQEFEALTSLVNLSGDLLDASLLSVWRFTANRDAIQCLALFADDGLAPRTEDTVPLADEASLTEKLLASRPILTLVGEDTRLLSGPTGPLFKCSYVLPIVIDQTVQGLVCIDYLEGELSAHERIFASALGGLVSIVFQRMRTSEVQFELQQSQKMEAVGRLAGGIAHDFNNLLTAITGFAELASVKLSKGQSKDEVNADLDQVLNTTERASTLTNQLLTFSRKEIVKLEVLDLNELLRNTLKMLGRVIREDIAITSELTDKPVFVQADRPQLEQVFLNLSVNASDAMIDGGDLTISTSIVGDSVLLQFTDTGIGIQEAARDKIFEPFFTTKDKFNSVGLGLSTVHRIVSESAGTIEVESQPGRGTTFSIYLPLQDPPLEIDGLSETTSAPLSGPARILVAEDEVQVLELMQTILESIGHEVLTAESGEAALAQVENGAEIELLVTDMIMPGMKGTELAERLRHHNPDLPVLFVSGYTANAFGTGGAELPENSLFLQKPFTSSLLIEKANSLIKDRYIAIQAVQR